MAVKHISTRVQICGRGIKCKGGHSAVEQSSYISRTTMYNEYDGITYYPKYSEDLVHTEVLLPKNAPAEYADAKTLWNAVETSEKSSNAQLARTYKIQLPNEWSYELATEVMRDYIKRNFVDDGMCAEFAIHDSENKKTGQRNLHCHILLTMRGIDEQGRWMPKQKKIYLTDENGERIPLIDKNTGRQKVDRQNRKQWKCATIPSNDWSSKENAKKWRKDLTDTINSVNERLGLTENFWEHRSFKEQGLDILPQIHLGAKASAMERAGIKSERGDINRDIVRHNALIEQAKATLNEAKTALENAMALPIDIAQNIRNEIIDVIRDISKRNRKLSLPIVKGKYLRLINNRDNLQSLEYMERFVANEKLTSYAELEKYKSEKSPEYDSIRAERQGLQAKIERLEDLLASYKKYEPYIDVHKESVSLKGFKKKFFDQKHIPELANYDVFHSELKRKLKPDEKITPMKWRSELKTYKARLEKTKEPYGKVVVQLACVEVLEHNRKELDRLLENERHQQERQQSRGIHRNNHSLD